MSILYIYNDMMYNSIMRIKNENEGMVAMDDNKLIVMKSALLHDVGKMILRANPGKISHSAAGVEYLKKYTASRDLLRAVGHHHAVDLRNFSGTHDDLSYIVYEADNIASSSDRRENESGGFGFTPSTCLENIFNVFGDKGTELHVNDTTFRLRGLADDDNNMSYPVEKGKQAASASEYAALMNVLSKNFQQVSIDDMKINELLQVLEAVSVYVPSSTAKGETADISLYDHQKLTAALASCLYDYFHANNITDYKAQCYSKQVEVLRQTDTYILLSADLSGIQSFIYTIPSKGALKSLRGRSFYLELLLENIADSLLEELELSRCNLLYNGGGAFHVLLPNIQKVRNLLMDFQRQINNWFLKNHGNSLYLAMGWVPCSADDFSSKNGNYLGKVYDKLQVALQKNKNSRYSVRQLTELFSIDSSLNITLEGERECSICHTSTRKLFPYEGDTLACESCSSLRTFGEKLLGAYCVVVHDMKTSPEQIAVPAYGGENYIMAVPDSKVEKEGNDALRIYVKNRMVTGSTMATRLWMGDYVTKSDNHVMELEELAALAGGPDGTGIKRLGVMRADVDDLGAAFSAGFNRHYDTLGRSTTLSRQLSIFFKRYINNICTKGTFSLFEDDKSGSRKVHIIYSGGDDMFIIGAWDDLIELAVDIRHAFRIFTNDKLTFSAGIGLFPDKCPISEMARRTGDMEYAAKIVPGKDSIALFGASTEQLSDVSEQNITCYKWQEFEEKVCCEKLAFLKKYVNFGNDGDTTKLSIGKGGLYRILGLLRNAGKRINLARFAYVLGRMEPAKKSSSDYGSYVTVRKNFYQWYRNEADRKQLTTAIELLIYHLRQKGEL